MPPSKFPFLLWVLDPDHWLVCFNVMSGRRQLSVMVGRGQLVDGDVGGTLAACWLAASMPAFCITDTGGVW